MAHKVAIIMGSGTDRPVMEKAGAALEEFALDQADQVRQSGEERRLEPMGSTDRKIVHDVIAEMDDVQTSSEGEEPRRRVVIRMSMPPTRVQHAAASRWAGSHPVTTALIDALGDPDSPFAEYLTRWRPGRDPCRFRLLARCLAW